MCFDFLYNIHLKHSKNRWVRYDQKCMLVSVYRTCIFVRFSWNINFLDISQKALKWQILWKPIQWEPSCSVQTGRQADRQGMMKLVFAFRNFASAPKNALVIECWQDCDITDSCHHTVCCKDIWTWFALCISTKSHQIQQYLKFTIIMCRVHSHPTHSGVICAIVRDEFKVLWWFQPPTSSMPRPFIL